MTKKQKQAPAVDPGFDEALARFAQTDPSEMAGAAETPDGGEIQLPKATHQGSMQVGGLDLDRCVLEGGRRVFHKRGVAKAPGMKSGGGNAFTRATQRKGLGSALGAALREKIANPISFKPLTQDLAHGYEAEVLVDVCKATIRADGAGKPQQRPQTGLAAQARIHERASAKVGVAALIDEATGRQQVRDPGALRILVRQYIEAGKREWERRFPDEYYDEPNRIHGGKRLTTAASGAVMQNRPQHFANFTRSHVYRPLENGAALDELDRIDPEISKRGTRRARFHQHLSLGYGIEKLERQVQEVMTLAKISRSVGEFERLFERRFPAAGPQPDLLND